MHRVGQIEKQVVLDEAEVKFASNLNGLKELTLNRPRRLNALSMNMFHVIHQQLQRWEYGNANSPPANCIVVRSESLKAFSAGGDMRQLALASVGQNNFNPFLFVYREYKMDLCIASLTTPYVSLLDGIAMGGGAGVAVNGRYRVVSEHVKFAMPETAAHWLPDVGATYFLSHLPCEQSQQNSTVGMFLALTGSKMNFRDCIYTGIGTHYVPRSRLAELLSKLRNATFTPGQRMKNHQVLLGILESMAEDANLSDAKCDVKTHRAEIDSCFGHDTLHDIYDALAAQDTVWSRSILAGLLAKPALILRLTFEAQRRGRKLTRNECLQLEYTVHVRVLKQGLFYKGVKKLLIDSKYVPDWPLASRENLQAVTEKTIQQYFAPLPSSHHPQCTMS